MALCRRGLSVGNCNLTYSFAKKELFTPRTSTCRNVLVTASRRYSKEGRRKEGRAMNIFDRNAKRLQKNRAACSPDPATYDYLRDEVASHVLDRVCDISRFFATCLDVGCGRGHIAKRVSEDLVGSLYQCDLAEEALVGDNKVNYMHSVCSYVLQSIPPSHYVLLALPPTVIPTRLPAQVLQVSQRTK